MSARRVRRACAFPWFPLLVVGLAEGCTSSLPVKPSNPATAIALAPSALNARPSIRNADASAASNASPAAGHDNTAAASNAFLPAGDGDGPAVSNAEAELVVGRDVVRKCPTLRLVRRHVDEFDPDTVWLAVLESIADCMAQGGPLAEQNIRVTGGAPERFVIGQVLSSHGVALSRLASAAASDEGALVCDASSECAKRVEITLVTPSWDFELPANGTTGLPNRNGRRR